MPDSEEPAVPESSSSPRDLPETAPAPATTSTTCRFAHVSPEELQELRDRGRGQYGCRHYRRRVRFIAPCCNEEWWCRHCHNEAKYQQEQDWAKKHELDRKLIKDVVCALCETRQPVSSSCISCGVSFGAYSCTQCPFYDDDLSKKTYHCDDCGICRVGGRENYFHCSTCGSCYAANLRNNHVCVERAMHQNCPVCFEFLFESVDPTTVLRCGHTIHSQCLRDLERNTAAICPSCPMCKKSLGDYSRYWEAIDREVAATPVPSEYRGWQANILCNDCSASSTVTFNLVAHKCSTCGSYNTRRMGILDTTSGQGIIEEEEGGVPEAVLGLPQQQGGALLPLFNGDDNGNQGGGGDGGAGGGGGGGIDGMAAAAAAANAALLQAMQINELHAALMHDSGSEDEWEDAEEEDE
ncbi:putative E3 ubiquitin-protein ligase RZFP34 [Nannochloris sp. 'desiccata']|nr:hypothetical protein KSW81_000253 [Chlorella desiccata (nom. nud.)]KAH7620092.1 putative E3 ubiquitin-protein ligase RZFP34 [Chlorella desiccata (nom. nud.)]